MTRAELLAIDDNSDDDVVVSSLDDFPPDTRPHIKDYISGQWVLLDTGAARSVWPRNDFPAAKADSKPSLRAANGTPIDTFGKRVVHLRLGAIRATATVTVVNVRRPILGWDWIMANQLQLRRRNGRYFLDNGRKRVASHDPAGKGFLGHLCG